MFVHRSLKWYQSYQKSWRRDLFSSSWHWQTYPFLWVDCVTIDYQNFLTDYHSKKQKLCQKRTEGYASHMLMQGWLTSCPAQNPVHLQDVVSFISSTNLGNTPFNHIKLEPVTRYQKSRVLLILTVDKFEQYRSTQSVNNMQIRKSDYGGNFFKVNIEMIWRYEPGTQ